KVLVFLCGDHDVVKGVSAVARVSRSLDRRHQMAGGVAMRCADQIPGDTEEPRPEGICCPSRFESRQARQRVEKDLTGDILCFMPVAQPQVAESEDRVPVPVEKRGERFWIPPRISD